MPKAAMVPAPPLDLKADAVRHAIDRIALARMRFDHASAVGRKGDRDADEARLDMVYGLRELAQLDRTKLPRDLEHLLRDPQGHIPVRPVPVPPTPRSSPEQVAEQLRAVLADWDLFSNAADRPHRLVATERLRDSVRFLHAMDPAAVPGALRELISDPEARVPKRP